MNKITDQTVVEATQYVFNLLNTSISKDLLYHSIEHTKEVLENAELIGEHEQLSKEELNILRISILFHDVGFIQVYDGHEKVSVLFAQEFLRERKIDGPVITQICNAILSTHVPQSPNDIISDILCDADLMNLSLEKEYLKDIELLRKEWIQCGKGQFTQKEFYQITLDFFKTHHFHTEYGTKILKPKKDKTEDLIYQVLQKNLVL